MDMNKTGSFTIEASFVFPLVFFALVTLLYIMIFAHEMTCLQSLANGAALEIQKYYEETDYTSRIERGLYFNGEEHVALEQRITAYVKNRAEHVLLIKDKHQLSIEVDFQAYVIAQKIKITIGKSFMTPFNWVGQWMNGSNTPLIMLKSYAYTKNIQPTGFVRGVDFIDDLSSEINAIKPIKDKYDGLLDKIEATLNQWI